ncbi:MAG: protein kinase [Acidobacteriota bacterium]
MTPERWKQIDELAQSALQRGGDERASFLDQACAGDDSLRREVESQIAYQQQASKFLEEPAFKHAAVLIADPQTDPESMEGRTIRHYSILRKLGAGGMGEVYLAQDTTLSRKVAIKFLSQNSVAGEQAKKRLVKEAKAAAALDHPHICAVYEVGEEAGYNFIVMQYVEGETLASRIQRQPIESREALDIAVQIADALAEAHSRRIIHRDIKPQNVMLTASGQVKVVDFGLARVVREGSLIDPAAETESLLTGPGSVMGTVPYMSPEQVRGEELDGRSDIFSFGAVLYEMLSGRNPFEADSVGATMSSILTREPPPLARFASDVPDELQRIVRKALSKNKEGRYQGIRDLLIDLRELKQELEFEAKLERSTGPESRDRSTTPERAKSGERAETETAPQQTGGPGESFITRTTSGAGKVIGEIKRHRPGVSLTLAALVVAAVAAYFYFNRKPVLTEHDTILLADFDNKTGDEIFDGTLKQGLAVQLEQSPFLSLFPDTRVRDTLKLMNRSSDERVTSEIGREICQRQGLKALIAGSIAPLGSHYVLTLEAVNSESGEVVAREQTEAESREQVLKALSQAASKLRQKLGESLSSIQKFDAPIEQVTTSSLEALKAFSLSVKQRRSGNADEAITLLKRAIEIDPNFALAYSQAAATYGDLGKAEIGAEYSEKAFQLRERVSEREKLAISSYYYLWITGELGKAFEVLKLWTQTYPRDSTAHGVLARLLFRTGEFSQTADEAREVIRLNPDSPSAYSDLSISLIRLNRFEEAKEPINQAQARGLNRPFFHLVLYEIACVEDDGASMKQQLESASGRPGWDDSLNWQARSAAFSGRLRDADSLSRRAAALARQRDLKETAALLTIEAALSQALVGLSQHANANLAQAMTLSPSSFTQRSRGNTAAQLGPIALALGGEVARAQSFADDMARLNPKNTTTQAVWLPAGRAAIQLARGHPDKALGLLQSASQYEAGALFWPTYLRGQAYLQLRRGAEASGEFQRIIDNRGWDPASMLWPLAHLGLARAVALTGDVAGSRKAYQDFLALWKDADADLPILIEVKKEYARLK